MFTDKMIQNRFPILISLHYISRTIPATGSFNISDLLPWRQYVVQVTATSIDHGITDFIRKYFPSTEQGTITALS